MESNDFIHFVGRCNFLPHDIISHLISLSEKMSPEQRKRIVYDLGVHIEEQVKIVDEAEHEITSISRSIDISARSNTEEQDRMQEVLPSFDDHESKSRSK